MARSNRFHDVKRGELIQIAFDLFLEQGYEATTIAHIMKAAGLSRGGMYHYFSSKEEVLDAVIRHGLEEEMESLRQSLDRLPVEEKMIALITENNVGAFARKLLKFRDDNRNSIVGYRVREYNTHLIIPLLEEIIRDGMAAGLYSTPYPRQMAAFTSLLVRAVVDTNFLPEPADQGEQIQRMKAFLHLANACFTIEPNHMARLEQAAIGQITAEWEARAHGRSDQTEA